MAVQIDTPMQTKEEWKQSGNKPGLDCLNYTKKTTLWERNWKSGFENTQDFAHDTTQLLIPNWSFTQYSRKIKIKNNGQSFFCIKQSWSL